MGRGLSVLTGGSWDRTLAGEEANTHTCMHTHMNAYMHTTVTYINACMHTDTRTGTHTGTNTCTYTGVPAGDQMLPLPRPGSYNRALL